jgi:hypothetical protein
MENYRASITADVSAETAYQVITEEMSDWWTTMSGQFLNRGDQAQTDFGIQTYWRFEAQTLDRPHQIELRCCEAHHIHEGVTDAIKEEWLDTVLRFDIKQMKKGTTITLTHQGLTPELHCFEVCKAGWDHYFLGSLKEYLDRKQ